MGRVFPKAWYLLQLLVAFRSFFQPQVASRAPVKSPRLRRSCVILDHLFPELELQIVLIWIPSEEDADPRVATGGGRETGKARKPRRIHHRARFSEATLGSTEGESAGAFTHPFPSVLGSGVLGTAAQ